MAESRPDVACLAKEIRAVLDSTPDGLNVQQIENDYRSLVGKSLKDQVKRLGYRDVDSFLLSLAQERAIEMENTVFGHRFRAGSEKSTAHIRKLVKNQVSKGKRSGKSRHSMNTTPSPAKKKQLPAATVSNITNMLRKRKNSFPLCNFIRMYHEEYGANFNFRSCGFSCLKEAISSIDGMVMTMKGNAVMISFPSADSSMSSPPSESARQKLCRAVTKVLGDQEVPLYKFSELYRARIGREFDPRHYGYSSTLNLMNDLVETVNLRRENDTGDWFLSHINYSSGAGSVQQPSNEPTKKKRIPHEMVKKICSVVEETPCGIYLGNFREIFKLDTGIDLSPPTYGFSSIQSLLSEVLSAKFEIISAKFGPLIRVKPSAEVTEHAQPVHLRSLSTEIQDAVGPGVCYNVPSTVPPLDRYITLMVSQIYDPSNFFVQLLPDAYAGSRLEELMDQLEEVYSPLESSMTYQLPLAFAVPGQLVVCRYPNDNHWHRARITKVIDGNFVQVAFVDYGTRCSVHKSHLYYLKQKFLITPIFAQRATLFGILPATGDTWSPAACKAFLNLTASKRLCAIVKAIDREQRLSVCLTDTTGEIDIHINDYLVTSEFAVFADSSAQVPRQIADELDWSVSSGGDSDNDDDFVIEASHETLYSYSPVTSASRSAPTSLPTMSASKDALAPTFSSPTIPCTSTPLTLTQSPEPVVSTCGAILASTSSPSRMVTTATASNMSSVVTSSPSSPVRASSVPFSCTSTIPSLMSIGSPPPLVSMANIPHQQAQNHFDFSRKQRTATVKPQKAFHTHPRFQHPPTNFHHNQRMSYVIPTPFGVQHTQLPVYRGYMHPAAPYTGRVPEQPIYYATPDKYEPHLYPPRQIMPANPLGGFAVAPSSFDTGEGRGAPVTPQTVNTMTSTNTASLVQGSRDGPPPLERIEYQSQSRKHCVPKEVPALLSVSSMATENTVSDVTKGRSDSPPPLEHVHSCNPTFERERLDQGPPPLVPVQMLSPTSSDISNPVDDLPRTNQALTATEHLKYKLAGLQLTKKRIQRDRVGAAGCTDNDSLVTKLDQEINECQKQLAKSEGQSADWSLKCFGRGRGRLNLASFVD